VMVTIGSRGGELLQFEAQLDPNGAG